MEFELAGAVTGLEVLSLTGGGAIAVGRLLLYAAGEGVSPDDLLDGFEDEFIGIDEATGRLFGSGGEAGRRGGWSGSGGGRGLRGGMASDGWEEAEG